MTSFYKRISLLSDKTFTIAKLYLVGLKKRFGATMARTAPPARPPGKSLGLGYFINRIQTSFTGLLRVWSIPIVVLLSVASGFTTYYGLSHFITPWIALVITVAIQSIIVICSLEIAGIHWRANRIRYFSVVASLLIALAASISFSYFKFYEISEQESLHIARVEQIRRDVKNYVDQIAQLKTGVLKQWQEELAQAADEVTKAYFGTHPQQLASGYKWQVGEGPFWRHYKQRQQEKQAQVEAAKAQLAELDARIVEVQRALHALDATDDSAAAYAALTRAFQTLQLQASLLPLPQGMALPEGPLLMSYQQFTEAVKPSFVMWQGFSWFAFVCAAMVDFFTVLLSYRLEFTAPGPLTPQEEELVFECIRQFTEFRINDNDELEMVIEKTPIEKARNYSDWSRMFAVGLLLSRGFLRKVDARTVEFSPNLYPLIAEKMSEKIRALKAAKVRDESTTSREFYDA